MRLAFRVPSCPPNKNRLGPAGRAPYYNLPNMPPKRTRVNNLLKQAEASQARQDLESNQEIPCLRGLDLQNATRPHREKMREIPFVEIVSSKISVYSDAEKRALSVVTVNNTHAGQSNTTADRQMGPIVNCQVCPKCKAIDCPGHYGLIDLPDKPSNPAYSRHVVMILHSVCEGCSEPYITKEEMKKLGILKLRGLARLQAIEAASEKIVTCTRPRKPVTQSRTLPSNCPKLTTQDCPMGSTYDKTAATESGIIRPNTNSKNEGGTQDTTVRDPNWVYSILNCITDENARLLGLEGAHPRDFMMKGLLVIPNVARPYTTEGGRINQNRLTTSYNRIVSASTKGATARSNLNKGSMSKITTTKAINVLFKTGGNSGHCDERRVDSFRKRLQRKDGVPRHNMMGKRGDLNGRSVASPNPSLLFDQISVPRAWVGILVQTEKVHRLNQKELVEAYHRGELVTITRKSTGAKQRADPKVGARGQFVFGGSPPELGDTVERKLRDGDSMMMNRHPTLHKYSMMVYHVSVWDNSSVGAHLSTTTPMNLDFDGDEINLWVLMSAMARADGYFLLNIARNILATTRSKPMTGLVMDGVTGSYLMTRRNEILDDYEFTWFREGLVATEQMATFEERCHRLGVNPRSAAALWSSVLPEDFSYFRKSRFAAEIMRGSSGRPDIRSDADPPLVIINGIIISGHLCSEDTGAAAGGIVHKLALHYGYNRAATFLSDIPILVSRYLAEYQFSTGIDDLASLELIDGKFVNHSHEAMKGILAKMYAQLDAIGDPDEFPQLREYRERKVIEAVNVASGAGLLLAKRFFTNSEGNLNSVGVMTDRGAKTKGNIGNMGQMIGMVGQQFYESERYGMSTAGDTRSTAYFDPYDLDPHARGLITNSLFHGVTPDEFHDMQRSGRVAMVKGSNETPLTGAAQRQMIKSYEGIIVDHQRSLVNATGSLLAPAFNGGFGTDRMVKVGGIYQVVNAQEIADHVNNKHGWVKADQMEGIEEARVVTKAPPVKPIKYRYKSRGRRTFNPEQLTPFEASRLVGTRATQIDNGALVKIDTTETNAFKIALDEYHQGAIELEVVRNHPRYGEQFIKPTLENIVVMN